MRQLASFFINNKRRAAIMAGAWTVCIFIGCLLPGREVPRVRVPMADKWLHFLIFGAFSFLWLCVSAKATARRALLVLAVTLLTGYIIELLQESGITSGRSYDIYDVVADGIGGAIGVLAFYLVRRFAREKGRP